MKPIKSAYETPCCKARALYNGQFYCPECRQAFSERHLIITERDRLFEKIQKGDSSRETERLFLNLEQILLEENL